MNTEIKPFYKLLLSNVSGKVKWTDARDGDGIVKDAMGNEYYFESSSSKDYDFKGKDLNIVFQIVNVPQYGPMAFNVKSLE